MRLTADGFLRGVFLGCAGFCLVAGCWLWPRSAYWGGPCLLAAWAFTWMSARID